MSPSDCKWGQALRRNNALKSVWKSLSEHLCCCASLSCLHVYPAQPTKKHYLYQLPTHWFLATPLFFMLCLCCCGFVMFAVERLQYETVYCVLSGFVVFGYYVLHHFFPPTMYWMLGFFYKVCLCKLYFDCLLMKCVLPKQTSPCRRFLFPRDT